MPAPSVIVFDLGKVLVDFDYSIAARRLAARSGLAMDPARFFASHMPLLLSYELGRINTEAFHREICAASGFRGSVDELGEFFAEMFTAIEPMVELHARVRQRKFPSYIFSNTNELCVRQIARLFPFYADFDGYVLSYEHGALKPDAKLYEAVERGTGRRGDEILYLDDRPENVAAGAARGWQTVLHESPEKTRSAFEKLGVLNGSGAP